LAGLSESNNVIGKGPILSGKSFGGPDLAGDLLKTIGKGLRITLNQSPARQHAVLGGTVVLASRGQTGGSGIRSVEVDGFSELHESDVVVELLGVVVRLVDVEFRELVVVLSSVGSLQVPFADADRVGGRIFSLSKAVSSAKDPLVSNEGATADVSVTAETEGNLPREFTVTSIDTVDDTATGSLLATLGIGRGCSHKG